ncbi:MAG: FkbM family methyltransferase [Flavobacteriia bacterium]|nr:FkbM family methyltransferase [Flavobacteriia bacterium]
MHSDNKEKDFFHFLSLLKDGQGAVLDVGANIGIMTVHLAQKLPNSTIHAFEPMPSNFGVLQKIVSKFKLKTVQLHEIALGESKGKVKMILPENGKTKMQGLSHVKHESITEWNHGTEFDVPLDTLDNVLNGEPIQGIKIDIENFEYYALKGGRRILEQNHPIIYAELWDNQNRINCIDLLEEFKYVPYIVVNDTLEVFNKELHTSQNFIFIAH